MAGVGDGLHGDHHPEHDGSLGAEGLGVDVALGCFEAVYGSAPDPAHPRWEIAMSADEVVLTAVVSSGRVTELVLDYTYAE
ncbi:MAG: hypothetical protein KC621_17505 [Myxococcales bacterium]|nr:hypothetical protein [Myxococcales bacterium]